MVPEVGIAPTSPPLQGGANLPQLLGGACARPLLVHSNKLVLLRGNTPRSLGYQPSALLLSYRRELAEGPGNAPGSLLGDPVFETGAASLYLPAFHKVAAQVGFAPTPSRLTGGWTTRYPTEQLALPAGVPPALFRLEGGCLMCSATAAFLKLVSAAGLAPAIPRSQAERVGCYTTR